MEEAGIDTSIYDRQKDIPVVDSVLGYAVKSASRDKVVLLLEPGADVGFVNAAGYGILVNAMHRIDGSGEEQRAVVETLIDAGTPLDVASDHGESAINALLELRALGVGLSVDDFGDRFVALKFIDRLKFDSIKIDPSFVGSVDAVDNSPKVVETILQLAHGLGMSVVAEGIERSTQFDRLRKLRCPEGQGYLFSKPVDPESIESMLEQGSGWKI